MRRPCRLLLGLSGGPRWGVVSVDGDGLLSRGGPPIWRAPWFSCYSSTRTKAGCPSGQWEWTVNPSRKLRRFESFTCHRVRERASDLRKRGRRPSSYTWRGYRKRPRFGGHQVLVPQACDLRKRVNRIGRVRGLWGMRTQVGLHTTVLAGLPAR